MKKIRMRKARKTRNRKIDFIEYINTTDQDGFPSKEARIIKTVWANIRGLRGKEFYEASSVQAENTKVFNCLYFQGLREDMFISYQGAIYNIKHIDNINELNKELEIKALRVDASE